MGRDAEARYQICGGKRDAARVFFSRERKGYSVVWKEAEGVDVCILRERELLSVSLRPLHAFACGVKCETAGRTTALI